MVNIKDITTPEELQSLPKPIIIRDEKGRFIKGSVPNPKGKAKGTRHFSTLLRAKILEISDETNTSVDKEIASMLLKKAKKGDLRAIDMVFDRVDGKAEQTINLEADIHTDEGLSKQEKEALLNLIK